MLDFEGVLKYFRVSLPRRYRSEEAAAELVRSAAAYKVRVIVRNLPEWD